MTVVLSRQSTFVLVAFWSLLVLVLMAVQCFGGALGSAVFLSLVFFIGLCLLGEFYTPGLCFLLSNSLVLVCVSYLDLDYSYLFTREYVYFYLDSYFFESVFWMTFIFLVVVAGAQKVKPVGLLGLNGRSLEVSLSVAILLIATEFFLNRDRLFVPYGVSSSSGTVLYEVSALLVAVCVYSVPKKRVLAVLGSAVAILLLLVLSMAIGKRLPLSYVMLAVFARLPDFKLRKFVSFSLMFTAVCAGFFWGVFRDTLDASSISVEMIQKNFTTTNQGGSFHASAVYVRVAQEGLISAYERFLIFINTIFSTALFPMTLLPEGVVLNNYIQKFYQIQGNGGNIGSYSFFFLGWLGPIILPVILSCLMVRSSRNSVFSIVGVMVFLTLPRWTMYNVGPIVRLTVYCFAVLYFGIVVSAIFGSNSIKQHLKRA